MKTKNKSFKRLFAFLVALVMVTALVPSVIFAATDLTDVEDSWAKEHIEYLLEKEVVRGFPDKTFRPEENVTRQQAAQMIAIGADLTASTGFVSKFVDVDKIDKDALVYVKALEDHKVISGFPDGSFGAVQPIKRSQAAKMIVNAFGLVKGELDVKFDDPVADAADQEYIDILASNGIVKGYTEDGKQLYKPYNLVTRAQLAKMIDLAMNLEDPTFRVVDVSAINRTGVAIEFEALAKAIDGATVEVLDNNNKVVEVKAQDLVEGETIATFEFVTALTADPKGVWTVGGVEHDIDLVNNINDFVVATTQTGIYDALVALGIDRVKVDNVPKYTSEKADWLLKNPEPTLADIQAFVDEVNKGTLTDAEDKAIAKVIIEAAAGSNDIVYKNAMKAPELVRVNPEWLGDYRTDIGGLTAGTAKIEDIQGKIDDKNVTKLVGLNAGTELDKVKLNKEKALLEKYTKPETDGKLPAATLTKIKEYNIQLALADLNGAKTAATFKAYFTKLVTVVDAKATLSMDDFTEANAKGYADKIVALNTATPATPVDTVAKVKTEVLAPVDTDAKEAVLQAIKDAGDADKLLKALKDAGIKEVVDGNKDAYWAKKAEFNTEADTSLEAVINKVKEINKAELVAAQVKAINEADTVAEVKTALDKLANVEAAAGYLKVRSVDRDFVAAYVLDKRPALPTGYDDVAAIQTVIGADETAGALEALKAVIVEVNGIERTTNPDAVVLILEKVLDEDFAALTAVEKSAKAEEFQGKLTFKADGKLETPFITLAAVKALLK